jgi:hypothetical protein
MNVTILNPDEIKDIAKNGALLALAEVEEKLNTLPMWMNLKQVCDYVNLSESKVREMIKRGFPCSTAAGDKRFFRPDVDRFMKGEL